MKKMGHRKHTRSRKAVSALAGVILAAVFFVPLFLNGITAPENPMEKKDAKASHMYLTSSTLAMDKQKLADIENANISSGGDNDTADAQDEEEPDEQEEKNDEQNSEENQQEQQSDETTSQDPENTQDTQDGENTASSDASDVTIPDSLMNLIQKNDATTPGNTGTGTSGDQNATGGDNGNGGNGNQTGGDTIPADGGQQTTLNPSQSKELFTTSLVDGDEVTDPSYPFTITLTPKGMQLKLVSMTVTQNGSSRICKSQDTLTLKEGANTVSITVRFRDSKYNQIDASTKTYTIYYYPDHDVQLIVTNAKSGEELNDQETVTIMQDSLWITVKARKSSGGQISDVASSVRMNNKKQNADSDGIYRMKLAVGTNQLKVTAGESGNAQKTISCEVIYKVDGFVLTFESDVRSEKISNNPDLASRVFKGITSLKYASTSPDFAFRIRCSSVTGQESVDQIQVTNRYGTVDMLDQAGADGYIHLTLDASQATDIKVYCTDSDGESQWYTWSIQYERVMDPAENAKKAPVIRADITNETVNAVPFIVPVRVFDYNGNELKANQNFSLYLNGDYVDYHSRQQDGTYEYNLYLTEGQNTVVIKAVDNEGYTAEQTLTVNFNPVKEEAKIRLIVSADVVGLGTWIDEEINTTTDQSVAQIVEDRLAAYGYTGVYRGHLDADDYFLLHIQKKNIAKNWSIADDERSLLDMLGYTITEGPNSIDSLGEQDFTQGSGWMVTLNHYFIGQTMGTRPIRDGDEIHLMYTLSVGKDIGVDPSDTIY